MSLKRDDVGTLPNPGSIGRITPVQNSAVGIASPTGLSGIPTIGVVGLFTIGTPASPDFFESTNDFIWKDMVSKIAGRHSLKIGAEIKRIELNTLLPYEQYGNLTFLSFADFLLGMSAAQNGSAFSNIYSATAQSGQDDKGERYTNESGFAQDDFKVNSALTLNLGLRWDHFGPPSDNRGRLVDFDPSFATPVPPATGSLTGYVVPSNYEFGAPPSGVIKLASNGLWHNQWKGFSPRLGFAYRLFNSDFVMRGGYGIYFQQPTGQFALQLIENEPFVYTVNRSASGNAAATFADPIPGVPPISAFPEWIPRTPTTSQGESNIDYNMNNGYTQEYSLGIQKSFGSNWLAEIGYVGSKSADLSICWNWNQPLIATPANPVNGATTTSVANIGQRVPWIGESPDAEECGSRAVASYNSLQASLTKNFSKGLQFMTSYTWSKSLDDGTVQSYNGLDLNSIIGDNTDIRSNYGPSSFNLTNRFVLSFVYTIPHLRLSSRPLEALANDWGFSGILLLQSGFPFSVVASSGGSIYGSYQTFAQCIPGIDQYTIGPVRGRLNGYFNPAAFAPAPPLYDGTGFGNCGSDILIGPHERNLDFAVHRIFPVHESVNFEFRAEAFNIANHPNFGNPANDEASPSTLGVISTTVNNPRILQLALKLNF